MPIKAARPGDCSLIVILFIVAKGLRSESKRRDEYISRFITFMLLGIAAVQTTET